MTDVKQGSSAHSESKGAGPERSNRATSQYSESSRRQDAQRQKAQTREQVDTQKETGQKEREHQGRGQ